MSQHDKVKLYAKFINHVLGASSALFELITGVKPPKLRELLNISS